MKRLNLAFTLLGAAGLAWLVRELGLAALVEGAEAVGVGFILGGLAHFSMLLCDAFTYRACAGAAGARVPLGVFIRSGLCGHAVNVLTPGGQLGEWTKHNLLRHHLPSGVATSAVILTNVFMFSGSCVLLALAAGAAGWALPLPVVARVAAEVVATGFLVAGGVALAVVWGGPARPLFTLARRVPVPPAFLDRAQALWNRTQACAQETMGDRRSRWMAVVSAVASPLFGVVETGVFLSCLGLEDAFTWALLARANSQVIAQVTSLIPLQAGAAEGGAYALFLAMGLDPHAGVLMELTRKARMLAFAALGLGWLGLHTLAEQPPLSVEAEGGPP